MYHYSLVDFIVTPIFLAIIFLLAKNVKDKRIEAEPYYKYYLPALFVKIAGGIGVCLIYTLYYAGGDTVLYFDNGRMLADMFIDNPDKMLPILFRDEISYREWFLYDYQASVYPVYTRSVSSFFVLKCTWFLTVFSFNSFIGATILLNVITFPFVWKLYKVFLKEFPTLHKEFALAVFFIPSVAFWGSGLLKDNITFAAVCLYTHAIYTMFVKREKYLVHIFQVLISSYVLTSIKPYIFFALLPGTFIWLAGIMLGGIDNKLVRRATGPIILVVSLISGYMALKLIGGKLGEYNIETVLNRAVDVQQDLKMEYYGGSTFDIGDFEATPTSMLAKAHLAITAALFRPFLWEAGNAVMLVSALENFLLLIFTIYLLVKVRVIYLFRLVLRHHLLVFSLTFSLFFAFCIGLTTSNFGSMVRYKIPAMPFYVASLIIARALLQAEKQKEGEGIPEKVEQFSGAVA